MSTRPLISVITAAYNASATLAETMASVRAQTFAEWEHIVIDDGSSDHTLQIAEQAAASEERVRVLSQANTGTAGARNAGLAAARGEWVCILDADDLLLPTFFERLLEFAAEEPGYDIYSADGEVLLRDGRRIPLQPGPGWDTVRSVSAREQLRESLVPGTSLARRDVFERCGGYRPVYSEDYDFWLRALILGARQRFLPERLWVYRRQEGSKTGALLREAESLLQILTDACAMPELAEADRAECERAVAFSRERIGRRELEEDLLRGEFRGARGRYLRARRAFPDVGKYLVGAALMLVNPRLYARVKAARMV